MTRPQGRYLEQLEAATRHLIEGDVSAAQDALCSMPFEPPGRTARTALSVRERAEVYVRDSFTCQYCGMRTIPECILRVFSAAEGFADVLPFNPNWRADTTHPAYFLITSSCTT